MCPYCVCVVHKVLCKSFFQSKWFSLPLFPVVPVLVHPLLESFCFSIVMPHPACSTNKSLLVGLPTKDSLLSTATSKSPVTSTASSSWSPQLANYLTKAVVRAIGNSIPTLLPLTLPVIKFISSAWRLIHFAWVAIYMWAVGRALCVLSLPWATSWLCTALLRDLSLQLVMAALLLGNSCHPQFSLSCTQLVISTPI